jgi:hypothetical protein
MNVHISAVVAYAVLACRIVPALAQPGGGKMDERAAKFAGPPTGFDAHRDGTDHGKLEAVEYDSTTVGVKRKARVSAKVGDSTCLRIHPELRVTLRLKTSDATFLFICT